MSDSISSSVDVAVDTTTAFKVFTEEINCWWLQGPINFHDGTQAYEKRIEPGVGGRILEVYDLASGDGLELGRVTAWDPGTRLAWSSSIDDVATEVLFEPIDGGTRVTVIATIAGEDKGGTAWVRMTPVWLGGWMQKRDTEPREAKRMSRLGLAVHYEDPVAAAAWLCDVFALEPAGNIPTKQGDEFMWIEFHVGNASLMVFDRDGNKAAVTHTPWVFVDDLDERFEHVQQRGAEIVNGIEHHGARWFTAADLEGNHWTFAQATPWMQST